MVLVGSRSEIVHERRSCYSSSGVMERVSMKPMRFDIDIESPSSLSLSVESVFVLYVRTVRHTYSTVTYSCEKGSKRQEGR